VPKAKAKVFNIPPGIAFVDALAEGIIEERDADPLSLSQLTILLPTRRSVRSLREAFLRHGGGKPMLLPAMRPIGDVDEEAFAFDISMADASVGGDGFDQMPPAVSEVERQLLLAELVREWSKRNGMGGSGTARAVRLAAELAHLIDQVQTARLTFEGISELVEGDLAAHWQETVRFLAIVTQYWPAILAERNRIDPANRRNRLLGALASQWAATPPAGEVIAA
jgi:ATP-dependent helicase/nuclease subunit B